VIRSQVQVHLLFPEHAVSDIHLGRCDTGQDGVFRDCQCDRKGKDEISSVHRC
jgi:hypothetical protein